jgi:hypothetical protein
MLVQRLNDLMMNIYKYNHFVIYLLPSAPWPLPYLLLWDPCWCLSPSFA